MVFTQNTEYYFYEQQQIDLSGHSGKQAVKRFIILDAIFLTSDFFLCEWVHLYNKKSSNYFKSGNIVSLNISNLNWLVSKISKRWVTQDEQFPLSEFEILVRLILCTTEELFEYWNTAHESCSIECSVMSYGTENLKSLDFNAEFSCIIECR